MFVTRFIKENERNFPIPSFSYEIHKNQISYHCQSGVVKGYTSRTIVHPKKLLLRE